MRKDSYDFEAKREYHQALRSFIEKQYPEGKRRRSLRVACLPGHEGLEVLNVYDKLGIKRDRIWGIERDPQTYEDIQNLGLSINLHSGTAQSFFKQEGEVFDIINLDFQSQFKQEEINTLSELFQCGRVKPRCILGTNFYGARENEHRQEEYDKAMTYYTSGGTINEFLRICQPDLQVKESFQSHLNFDTLNDSRDKLEDTRDKSICLQLRGLTSANTLRETYMRMNATSMDHWIAKIQYPFTQRQIAEDVGKHRDFILLAHGYFNTRLGRLLMVEYQHDISLRDTYYSFIESSELQRPRFITDFKKGKYISDNGSPMYFDFLHLQLRDDLFTNLHTEFRLNAEVSERLVFRDSLTPQSYSGRIELSRLGDSICAQLGQDRIHKDPTLSVERVLENSGLFILGDHKRFYNRLNQFIPLINKEMQYIRASREELLVPTRGECIRTDLFKGKPECEIISKYGLSTHELAGHKAVLSRQNKTTFSPASSLHQPTEAEEEQIREYLERGCASDEQIIFSYGISKMQLAARKAHITMKKNRLQEQTP